MGPREMRDEAQRLKEECVAALFSGNPKLKEIAEAEAKEFLANNYAQILDILDDSLTFVVNGGNIHTRTE